MKNLLLTTFVSLGVVAFTAAALYATYPLEVQHLDSGGNYAIKEPQQSQVAGVQPSAGDTAT